MVDRSSGRNSRLCSDAGETLLDSCIRQTVNEDISMPSVTSFIWCSLSFSFSFYFQQWNNLPWCLAVIFFSFLCIFSSQSPLINPGNTATYQLFPFLSHYLFILPPNSYLYLFSSFFAVISLPRPPSSPFIFSLSLSLSQSCSLWC